jgi:WD40 repeat protein
MKKMSLLLVMLLCLLTQAKTFTAVKYFDEDECLSGSLSDVVIAKLDCLLSISVVTTGTDESVRVYLLETIEDEDYYVTHTGFLFSSANSPNEKYVITSVDADGNVFGGYPTTGPIKIRIEDNDLTACMVIVKFAVYPK